MKPHPESLPRTLTLALLFSAALAACNKQPDVVVPAATPAHTPIPVAAAPTTIGTEIDDSVVTARVKAALLADPGVKSFDIQVETRKGLVQLSGFVNNQMDVESALALVNKLEGVKGVDNGMSIKDGKSTVGSSVDDSVLTAKIKTALLADAAVKSSDIAVITRKGEVQLSGFANDAAQINRATEVARGISGVKAVINEMSVKK